MMESKTPERAKDAKDAAADGSSPASGTCAGAGASAVSGAASAVPSTGGSRKRKPDPQQQQQQQLYQQLTKKQCVERLVRIQQHLECPVCLQTSYAPFLFPCGEHIGCFACIVQMALTRCPVE